MGICICRERKIVKRKSDINENNISQIIEGAESLNHNNEKGKKKVNDNNKNNDKNKQKKRTLIDHDKKKSIPKSNIGRSNINGQSNNLNKKNQSENVIINKKNKNKNKNKKIDIKEYSQSENNQFLNKIGKEEDKKIFSNNETPIVKKLDNNINDDVPNDKKMINNSDKMEKEDDKKISTNVNEFQILEKQDNSINSDAPDDSKISQKKINSFIKIEKEDDKKIFTNINETPILQKQDNDINNDVLDNNKISQNIINSSIKNESNYNKYDINKNYFFGCPQCLNVPYIESLECDINKKDIFVTYICKCELKERTNSKYLCDFIIEKEPNNLCQIHSPKELIYYCKTCNIKICIDCYKEQHNNHEINNNYLMSEENEKAFIKMKDNFKENNKGYDILLRIYDEYIKVKNINSIDNFNIINDNKYSNKINNDKVENDSINVNESDKEIRNDKSITISREVYESVGFLTDVKMKQNERNDNLNFHNSRLEEIIEQQNNNDKQNLNISNKDNKNINRDNLNIEDSQNINDFRLFGDLENSREINSFNDCHKNQNNILLNSIKEEINESKNISINEDKNDINLKKDKLKYYYNSKTLKNHESNVISLIQLQSGYLASGASDGSIIIWDIYKNKIISKFYEVGQALCLLEFEPNKLLVGTSETNIGLWDLNALGNNSSFNFLKHSLWVNCLVKIDNNTFASASNDNNIYIWDYYNRTFLFGLTGHTDCITTLIKLDDGRLCSGSIDKTIKIWNLENRKYEQELIGHKNWIKSLYQLKNGILLSSDVKSLIFWKNFSLYKSINSHCEYRNLCQIDDNCLAGAAMDNTIDLFDLNNYQKYDSLKGHFSNVICVIKLKDNKLASCSLDKTIKIWDQKL